MLENEKEILSLTDKEIFTKIWTNPRQVFKYINETNYDKHLALLLVLTGITRTFDRAFLNGESDTSLWATIVICIVVGAVLGWLTLYIYAGLLSWTGKWFNGIGNTSSILRILSYAMIPSIITLTFLIPEIGLYGAQIFKKDGVLISESWISNSTIYALIILKIVLTIWSLILCVIGVSEVQNFPVGKSVLNLLMPIFIILIPIVIIAIILK